MSSCFILYYYLKQSVKYFIFKVRPTLFTNVEHHVVLPVVVIYDFFFATGLLVNRNLVTVNLHESKTFTVCENDHRIMGRVYWLWPWTSLTRR